jgi:hypothetical protein
VAYRPLSAGKTQLTNQINKVKVHGTFSVRLDGFGFCFLSCGRAASMELQSVS